MKKITKRITVIGAGNIGLAIAEGISTITKNKITITRKNDNFTDGEKVKFKCLNDNKDAVSTADIVIMAVQPKQIDEILKEIKNSLTNRHILISVASGVNIGRIEELISNKIAIARAMPNTSIKVKESMTCLAFNKKGSRHENLIVDIFNEVGLTLLIPETMFTEATVLCGSGVALALKFLRAYMEASIQHGFNKNDALNIASQVLKGAATIIQNGGKHPEAEIDNVTTPGGCTIIALAEMEHTGFSSALLKAIEAGIEKAKTLY